MSLINKTLKELEQRQGTHTAGGVVDGPYVRAASPPSSSRVPVLGTLCGLLATAFVVAVWYLPSSGSGSSKAAPPAAPPVAARPAIASPAIAAPVAAAPMAIAAVKEPQPAPATAPVAPAAIPTPQGKAVLVASVAAAPKPEAPPAPAKVEVKKQEPPPAVVPAVASVPPAPKEPSVKTAAASPAAVPAPPLARATPKPELATPPSAQPTTTAAAKAAPTTASPAAATAATPAPAAPSTAATPAPAAPGPALAESKPDSQPVRVATAAPRLDATLVKSMAPEQVSENMYKQAVALIQQGNRNEARPALRKALDANPSNSAARLLLVNLLLESNDVAGASTLLKEGVRISPDRGRLWMTLARVEIEQSDSAAAMATLEKGLPAAGDDAQYHAFYAALLQRAGRHDDAVKHYLVALRSDPAAPTWLVGIGISLQSIGKDGDAVEAFQRARAGGRLSPSLAAFVDQRLEAFRR